MEPFPLNSGVSSLSLHEDGIPDIIHTQNLKPKPGAGYVIVVVVSVRV